MSMNTHTVDLLKELSALCPAFYLRVNGHREMREPVVAYMQHYAVDVPDAMKQRMLAEGRVIELQLDGDDAVIWHYDIALAVHEAIERLQRVPRVQGQA